METYRKDHVVAAGRHNRRFTIGLLDVNNNEMPRGRHGQF